MWWECNKNDDNILLRDNFTVWEKKIFRFEKVITFILIKGTLAVV